jgi:hypothetical protein
MRPTFVVLLLLCVSLFSTSASASGKIPIRGASQNGQDTGAAFWNLLAPTVTVHLTAGTKTATYTRQIVCPQQDAVSAEGINGDPTQTGTCSSGSYLYIYQFMSNSLNAKFTFQRLVGFKANAVAANYGAILCDDNSANTLTLCTTATASQLPNITFTQVNSNTVTFGVPSIPAFPAGTGNQGQGLTLFFITTQSTGLPIPSPTVGIQ